MARRHEKAPQGEGQSPLRGEAVKVKAASKIKPPAERSAYCAMKDNQGRTSEVQRQSGTRRG